MRGTNLLIIILTVLGQFVHASLPNQNNCSEFWREVDWKVVPFIEVNAKYFSYQFKIPAGKKLQFRVDGRFPIARYMSFHVYDQLTENPISRLTDIFVPPKEGSNNPYLPGVDRYLTQRNYSFAIPQSSSNHKPEDQNIWIPFHPDKEQLLDIWFRVYVSEEKEIPLPQIYAFDAEGKPTTCPELSQKEWSIATEPGPLDFRVPVSEQRNKMPLPFKNGEVHFFKPSTASLGANLDNHYLSTRLDGKALFPPFSTKGRIERRLLKKYNVINDIGNISALKFKLPSFPDTLSKLKYFTGKEEVRYWSVCLSDADTYTSQCLMDSQVKQLTNGSGEKYAVLIIGPDSTELKEEAAKRNYNFMSHSELRVPLVFFRQMLAKPTFEGRVEKVVPLPEELDPETMPASTFFGDSAISEYSPTGYQCWFESSFFSTLCGLTP